MTTNVLDARVGTVTNLFQLNTADGGEIMAAFVLFDDDTYIALDVTGLSVTEGDAVSVKLDLAKWDVVLSGTPA